LIVIVVVDYENAPDWSKYLKENWQRLFMSDIAPLDGWGIK
jgi:hypothetical protein